MMIQLLGTLAFTLVICAVGVPVLLMRRKKFFDIVKSGDSGKIPRQLRDRYAKKGIAEQDYLNQFEKDNTNFSFEHPVLFITIICIVIFFVGLFHVGNLMR